MKAPWRRGPSRLDRLTAAARLDEAMGRIEPQRGLPEPAVPQPETPRLLCYSPAGSYVHDDAGGAVPRPACHAGAKRYVRAVTPDQERRAAALKPCPHCARLRESSEGRAAS